jgi:hypothetical protein
VLRPHDPCALPGRDIAAAACTAACTACVRYSGPSRKACGWIHEAVVGERQEVDTAEAHTRNGRQHTIPGLVTICMLLLWTCCAVVPLPQVKQYALRMSLALPFTWANPLQTSEHRCKSPPSGSKPCCSPAAPCQQCNILQQWAEYNAPARGSCCCQCRPVDT